MEKIDFEKIIFNLNQTLGKLILLTERPGLCAIETCLNIIKIYKGSYFFDFDGESEKLKLKNKNIDYNFYSSVELINKIYNLYKLNNITIFIINRWKLIENKENWFVQKLLSFVDNYNIKIIITDTFQKIVDNRKNHLPLNKDFKKLNPISNLIQTEKIYCINFSNYYHNEKLEDKISYYKY